MTPMPDGPARVGPYRLLSRLGVGGMGEVFRARKEGTIAQEVALKLISGPHALDERARKLFEREARTLASLNHRSIVRFIECASAGERLYLVTELLDGLTLRELSGGGTLPWDMVALAGAEVARALAAAHALRTSELPRGLVHGDVSPSNVMACADGAIKLLDFGIARPSGAELSTSNVEGKLSFLPPEAISGRPKEISTDVYGLGMTLYVLLSGSNPMDGSNPAETVQRILRLSPPSLRMARPDVPEALDRLIAHAIEREQSKRLPTCEIFARELERLVEGRVGLPDLARFVATASAAKAQGGGPVITASHATAASVLEPKRPAFPRIAVAVAAVAMAAIVLGLVVRRVGSKKAAHEPLVVASEPTPIPGIEDLNEAPALAATATVIVSSPHQDVTVLVDGAAKAGPTRRAELQVTAGVEHRVEVKASSGSIDRRLTLTSGSIETISVPAPPVKRRAPAQPKKSPDGLMDPLQDLKRGDR